MKVFISHSGADAQLAAKIGSLISEYAETIFWNQNKVPGEEDWKSIFGWIQSCDIVIALVSKSAIERGISVGQEIGYAKKADKLIIPFVSKKIPVGDLGFLKGLTAIHYDDTDPSIAIDELKQSIQIHKTKSDRQTIAFVIGLIALFFLPARKSDG